uniref:Uncharacterized protein n=1 Tax=Branchiostoma floridae TaxID=7739 RepID=C3Y6J0_BRAFL|eukprot:XP_002607940.1 hypothetical protein BRAFLDRAFT_74889 [Branchiostoma floridae]
MAVGTVERKGACNINTIHQVHYLQCAEGAWEARPRRCPKKCGTIVLVTVCVVLIVAVVMLGVKLGKKHMMAGKHGCRDSGEEGHMGNDDCEEMEDMDEMDEEGPQSDGQDGDGVNSRWCIDKTCP